MLVMANFRILAAAAFIAGGFPATGAIAADAVPDAAQPQQRAAPKPTPRKVHHRHTVKQQTAPNPAQAASLHRPSAPALPPVVGDAPVPNEDVQRPGDAQSTDPNLQPSIFSLHYPSSGDGYIAGSSPQTIDNEHAGRIGGAQLTVPLK